MKKGQTLKGELTKLHGGPKQYQQGWTEFYSLQSKGQNSGHPPIQYQRGWTEFYKLKFKLTPDVLIPRPETELLVDEVLKDPITHNPPLAIARGKVLLNRFLLPITIIEIGTGSGAIAISIAKNSPTTKIIATDISEKALKIAEQNAKFHQVENQIIFLQSDLLQYYDSLVNHSKSQIDIIVANLPYIPTTRLLHIDPLVSEFEPKLALDGGQDGFELYRRLFSQMKDLKLTPKVLLLEIDQQQAPISLAEAKKYFPDSIAVIKKDLAHKDRILRVDFN